MEQLKKGKCSQTEIALHTHDRIAFKRCRRKWSLSSPFKRHLQPRSEVMGVNQHLWFGSGMHFALEDYHGPRAFDNPVDTFNAYVAAHTDVPTNVDELVELGRGMLDHYVRWEAQRSTWTTYMRDGKPLVEEKFSLVLEPLCHYKLDGKLYYHEEGSKWLTRDGWIMNEEELVEAGAEYVEIVYHGTLDRLVVDKNGDVWVLDYKTTAAFDISKLPTDPQISAYCWAAEQWLGVPIAGMLYVQMLKRIPSPPRVGKTGISADKTQKTTHYLYRQALIETYGEVSNAPTKNVTFLNYLADTETENGDAFIRYDWVPRNTDSKIQTYHNIIAEGREMLDPNLALYPNPTRDCSWECPFRDMCIAMDEGADWESYLFDFEERVETMSDDIPAWMKMYYRQNKDRYPEEYKQYCSMNTVDTLEEFLGQM